jgi:hypothetical protein
MTAPVPTRRPAQDQPPADRAQPVVEQGDGRGADDQRRMRLPHRRVHLVEVDGPQEDGEQHRHQDERDADSGRVLPHPPRVV